MKCGAGVDADGTAASDAKQKSVFCCGVFSTNVHANYFYKDG